MAKVLVVMKAVYEAMWDGEVGAVDGWGVGGLGVSRQGGRIGAVTAVGWGILTSKADVGVFSKGGGWSRSGLDDVRRRDLSVDKAVEDPGTRERLCFY